MGFPLITFNGRTINFTKIPYRLQVHPSRQIVQNQSASGKSETLNVRAEVTVEVALRWFVNANATDATLKRNLQQWFSWATKGLAWNFGMDSAHTVYTTLSANAAAGATALSLTTLTGVVVNGLYIVRNELNLEVVKVTALNSPGAGQVTIADPLTFAYFSGDRFRSEKVWPARLLSMEHPIIDHPVPNHPFWDFELKFTEDLNDL